MKHIVLLSASVLAIAAVPAHAQTTPAENAAPVGQATPASNAPQGAAPSAIDTEQEGLQDIIVTAQRVEQSAQKTPIAIAVISPQELTRQNVTRAEDLSRVVPALVTTASGGPNTSFFIRGVGNSTVNSYSDAAISFNYDGIYIGRPNSTQGFFYDLQRVEVLKGPQGTLYGRNATGGAINVLPNRPRLGVTSGEFQASYGNYNAVQGQAAINLPIGDKGALRVAGAINRHDGYLSDGTSDQREEAVRAQVLAELTPDLTTRIGVDYSHQGGVGTGSFVYGTYGVVNGAFAFTPTPQLGPKVGVHDPRTEAFVQTRFIPQAGRFSEATGTYPRQNNAVWGITNETNWTTAAGTLTVQAGYRESDINSLSTTSNFRTFNIKEHAEQTTLEARFAGKIGTIADYLVGAFLFDEDIGNSTALNQLTVLTFQDYKTGTNSKAAFGRLAVHATDTLTLTAAGRYTDDRKYINGLSNNFVLFCGNPAPPQDFCPNTPLFPAVFSAGEVTAFYGARGIRVTPVPLFALPPAAGGSQTAPFVLNAQLPNVTTLNTKKFTYRLAADLQVTPSNLLYASFETGFHSGGFNFGRGRETYRPETIQAYTIGSKNRFFGNRLQLNIEGFYWKYKDQQIAQFGTDFSSPPVTVFYTDNIGRSTIKGVDVDVDFLLTRTTRINGSVQYLDNRYDNYTIATAQSSGVPNFACPYTPVAAVGTVPAQFSVDCSGKQGLFSPKWSFNVSGEQTFELGDYKLVAQGGTRWRGDYFAATSYQPWVISKAVFQSDASLTVSPNSNAWFASLFVNNIENHRRITQSNVSGALSTQSGLSTAPRTYGIRIGGRFK
ncbi:TonB-dependent receptor [Sphingomonas sp. GB1N7]|uniref:TonB-dependent receptor n=1 Tax=Parasphingomonas caseinilytica TaxID=3096158 RepID=UPI002FC9C7D8